ncbi:hypothetical protein VNI00_004757 [Paramarasmius palmivorus]|uniref:Transmembrane protein n=1 Tax=Paramarasmius palmivorus TaxID=297713 RepID=A0AAW0DK43_9AGAR
MATLVAYPSERRFPRKVVVDDSDARISYSNNWTFDVGSFDDIGSLGAPYNHTMHGTGVSGSTLNFTFEGGFIQVWGAKETRNTVQNTTIIDDDLTRLASWKCLVDGDEIPRINYLTNVDQITNNLLCEASGLASGTHVLTVDVAIGNSTTQVFWFDKIEYVPPDWQDSGLEGEILKIDSSDPSIRYDNGTGSWQERPAGGLIANTTDVAGESLSFKFNGTSVSLFGFISGSISKRQASNAVYSIDGSPDTLFEISGSRPSPTNSSVLLSRFNEPLFTTPDLELGTHDMKITFTGVRTGGDPLQWLTVDYFYVNASAGSGNSVDSGPGQGSLDPNAASENSGTGRPNIGAIIGGTVGGVAGILLLALGVFIFLRRRTSVKPIAKAEYQEDFNHASAINPNERYMRSQPLLDTTPISPESSTFSDAGRYATTTPSAKHPGTISWQSTSTSPAGRMLWERHHQDSGIRYPTQQQEMEVVDVPPGYTAQ